MATKQTTIETILEGAGGAVSAKKMFGEYGLYLDGKFVALVCDDQLFLKPTEAGRSCLGEVIEGQPYPGAKPHFLVPGETWDDADWLAELLTLTAAALPEPAPKKARRRSKRTP